MELDLVGVLEQQCAAATVVLPDTPNAQPEPSFNKSYEFSVSWDPLRGGYVAVDAIRWAPENECVARAGGERGGPPPPISQGAWA